MTSAVLSTRETECRSRPTTTPDGSGTWHGSRPWKPATRPPAEAMPRQSTHSPGTSTQTTQQHGRTHDLHRPPRRARRPALHHAHRNHGTRQQPRRGTHGSTAGSAPAWIRAGIHDGIHRQHVHRYRPCRSDDDLPMSARRRSTKAGREWRRRRRELQRMIDRRHGKGGRQRPPSAHGSTLHRSIPAGTQATTYEASPTTRTIHS